MSFFSPLIHNPCCQSSLVKCSHSLTQAGDVPLGIAAEEGYVKIVEMLLKAKANINFKNKVIISLHHGRRQVGAWGVLKHPQMFSLTRSNSESFALLVFAKNNFG